MKHFLMSLFMFCWATLMYAQNELHFNHLGLKEGFLSNTANAIIQDSKGFIWVGTWNGLSRYDGYACRNYQPNFHDSTTILNREIVELMEGSDGNIWIGTSNGLSCLNPETGMIKNYEFQNRILSLCEDDNQYLWIGTWGGGLHRLNPKNGEITHFLADEIVSDICFDSRKILWVGTYNGLLRFDRSNGQYHNFISHTDQNSISNTKITQIVESFEGHLWVGTWGGGLNRVSVNLSGTELSFTHFTHGEQDNDLGANVISKLHYDQFNNLWIGTWNKGLRLLHEDQQNLAPEKTEFVKYLHENDNPSSISGNGISAIFVDKTGVLWVSSSAMDNASIVASGINRYKLQQEETFPGATTTIRALAVYKNQLWIASGYNLIQYSLVGNIYLFRKKYERDSFSIKNKHYHINSILDLSADSTGLWVGTDDAGLLYYPYSDDNLLQTDLKRCYTQGTVLPIPGNKISCIEISRQYPGLLWIGTMQSGFSCIITDPDYGLEVMARQSHLKANKIADKNIRCIKEDRSGNVWIGTQNGLYCYDPTTNELEQFHYSPADTTSINDNVVNSIYEDSFGQLWIGTNAGLNKKVDVKSPSGKQLIIFKGYPDLMYVNSEIVTDILEDQSQNLWIRMFRGFVKFDLRKEVIQSKYFSRDYENVRLERNISIKGENGKVIIANSAGFLTFNPDNLLKRSVPLKAVITDFQIFNESIPYANQSIIENDIKVTIPFANKIRVSHDDKMLTFVFSAMDFNNLGKNEYSFMLDGFDQEWNIVRNRNTATYTNIPYGEYIFKVKAKNYEGLWSKEEAQLTLIITPPWWKTIWVYLLYALFLAGLLYFFNKYTIIKAREKAVLKFEKLKNEEITRMNNMKSNFFTDITHELKTPLTLILGPARELTSDKKLNAYAAKQADLIQNSAFKLLRLVNQLMEFGKIEKGVKEELFAQRCDINLIVNDVYSSFKAMAKSRKIDFSLETENDLIIAFVDPDKIDKVVFNLVSNAFKYSGDGSKILLKVKLRTDEDDVQTAVIEVSDTGIGIAKEYQEKIFERFFQVNQIRTQSTGGIGLYMAKTLVEQHGGSITFKSEPGRGSCFRIEMPINTDLLKTNMTCVSPVQKYQIESKEDIASKTELQEAFTSSDSGSDDSLILVIEDDHDLNDFIVSGLSSGFRVIHAFNGKEGLIKARKYMPNLILTDIMMPEMDGFEFCRIIRKDINLSHIPVIFLTAKTMYEDEIRGLKLGAIDYIYKPFNLISLRIKIDNILITQKHIQYRLRTEQLLEPESMVLSSLDEIFLKNAVESVNKNLANPNFGIDAFSQDLGVSSNHLYRKIKALTGQTANEFIRTQRLKVAAGILVQKKRAISEVIYMVGFNSPSYFSRCFKEFYGCTPKVYMDNN